MVVEMVYGGNMVSISTMIEQLGGLQGTSDLTSWESEFVRNIVERYHANKKRTDFFTAKVVEINERIWSKHFAG